MKVLWLLALLLPLLTAQNPPPLVPSGQIDLPGVDGRIDHFSADLLGKRLFLAALGNGSVEVLDVAAAKPVHRISPLAEPQGLLFEPASNRIFVASGKDGTARLFDGTSYRLLDTIKFASNADNVRFDARRRQVLVGFGGGVVLNTAAALALLDTSGKLQAEIPLAGHPESFQLEKTGNRVFVNVPHNKNIEVADLNTRRVIARWPLPGISQNYPMALDEAHGRLFVGCRTPARLVVFDTANGKDLASLDIVGDTDDLFYDAARHRLYVIGGDGFVDVFAQTSPNQYEKLARYPTAPGARTGLYVPEWSKLFVAVPHRGSQRAQVLIFDAK